MKREFAILDVEKNAFYRNSRMDEDLFDVYVAILLKKARQSTNDTSFKAFKKYFKIYFYICGKPVRLCSDLTKYDAAPRVSIVEIVHIPNDDNFVNCRIISPEELYYTCHNLDTHKYTLPSLYQKPHMLDWYRDDKDCNMYTDWGLHTCDDFKSTDLTHDRWLVSSPFRKAHYRNYLKALDDKFYRANDEPLARKHKSETIDEIVTRWEQPVSTTANWKNVTKDKFQWQHNLSHRQEVSVHDMKQVNQLNSQELNRRILKLRDYLRAQEKLEDKME